MNWYAKKWSGGQGIVIDEDTGRNVAIAYDEKDTALLAAAPEMAEALRYALRHIDCHEALMKASAALEKAGVA